MCTYDKYQIIETLGEGTFGKVKLAVNNGKYCAIKFSTKSNAYSQQVLESIFQKQSHILSELNHPNIIKLYEAIRDGVYHKQNNNEVRSGLVFQYAPYNLGELLQFGPLDQTIARTLFSQMINALSYLHSQNIIHRDIKPQNILFDEHFTLKIADFGLSTKIAGDSKPKTICGSEGFKSPQLLLRKNYNGIMNDLFAAAVTLFILVSAKAPFISATPSNGLYKFIALNYIDKFWSQHEKKSKFSAQLKDLLNSMLAFDPTHRLSISEILSHPWMNGDILINQDLQTQMRKIQMQTIQKKRKRLLNNLKLKSVEPNAYTKRSNSTVDPSILLKKIQYRKELSKLSDRFVPYIKNYEELEQILSYLQGDVTLSPQGQILLSKLIGQSGQKLTIQIKIQNINQDEDCLKFKLKEGNFIEYVQTLQLFDRLLAQ